MLVLIIKNTNVETQSQKELGMNTGGYFQSSGFSRSFIQSWLPYCEVWLHKKTQRG